MKNIVKAALLGLVVFSSACSVVESKDKGLVELRAVEQKWEDGLKLASSTSRIALSTPVANLQAIRREVDTIPLGECLKPASTKLRKHMDTIIEGFLSFMGDDKYTAERKLKSGETLLEEYRSARDLCSK